MKETIMPENGETTTDYMRDNMPPRDSRSRGLLYGLGIMIMAIFVVAFLLTLSANQDTLSEADVRQIVSEAVGTQIAAVPVNSGANAGVSSDQLQQIVNDAVGTQIATLIPTSTPIPPTPTIIPRAVAEDDDPFQGPADAPVVIVEFSDFQCGFCGRWYKETLPQILAAYPNDVKFVYRDFTIFGQESLRAATAADCANEQGKFWEMHNRLFDRLENQENTPLVDETFVSYAQELGLDTAAFSECLSSDRYVNEVLSDYQAAQQYGLQGTPGFVIDGVVYTIGAQPFQVFDGIIKNELARAQNDG
jgi:protein-disulfide isomerase